MERTCVASIRSGQPCGKPTKAGFKFCEEHSQRPNAIKEREERSLNNVVQATEVFTGGNEIQKQEDKANAVQVRENLENKNVYEKTTDALNEVIAHQDKMAKLVAGLGPDEIRYTDKAGAEQMHSFMALYERAMDRTIRGVTAVAKLNIDAQAVNVNKMLRELIKSCVSKALLRYGLAEHEVQLVRQYLAEELEAASKESA